MTNAIVHTGVYVSAASKVISRIKFGSIPTAPSLLTMTTAIVYSGVYVLAVLTTSKVISGWVTVITTIAHSGVYVLAASKVYVLRTSKVIHISRGRYLVQYLQHCQSTDNDY